MKEEKSLLKEVITFLKSRGFVYQNSEIYGGLANTWDYGPLGVELKRSIKELWWKKFINSRIDMVGLDSAILMNPKVWETSGHLDNFSDPLVDCKECKSRFRADHLLEEQCSLDTSLMSLEDLNKEMITHKDALKCPICAKSNFTPIREFNLMFETYQGVTKDSKAQIYLRPETAQGIFVQFKNILTTTRKKIPFGVGQIGKSFRNEITPGNFIFRTREFEQMEVEYFVNPKDSEKSIEEWILFSYEFFTETLGFSKDKVRKREHSSKELAHYSDRTCDIEFYFDSWWGEIAGIASRRDYDLKLHQEASKEDLTYFDPHTNEKYLPYVIEPSFGVDRAFFALLMNSYCQEDLGDGKSRIVLKLKKNLAPISIAVLPLKKNEDRIVSLAKDIIAKLSPYYKVMYDDTGSIGKLYRRQDEIGTPYCLTVDFDSLENKTVTIRDRDSMEQKKVAIEELLEFFKEDMGE